MLKGLFLPLELRVARLTVWDCDCSLPQCFPSLALLQVGKMKCDAARLRIKRVTSECFQFLIFKYLNSAFSFNIKPSSKTPTSPVLSIM